ncbi:MAG: hypothetical protein IPL91_10965 [Hyphomicrobium sp.]|nr:hypothetical protein [Hyphomicrobium sp.]
MDGLTFFGLCAVTAMLLFYAFEDSSSWYVLGFAISCGLASIYGFLQSAWPFGVVEAIWTVIALKRWQKRRLAGKPAA